MDRQAQAVALISCNYFEERRFPTAGLRTQHGEMSARGNGSTDDWKSPKTKEGLNPPLEPACTRGDELVDGPGVQSVDGRATPAR